MKNLIPRADTEKRPVEWERIGGVHRLCAVIGWAEVEKVPNPSRKKKGMVWQLTGASKEIHWLDTVHYTRSGLEAEASLGPMVQWLPETFPTLKAAKAKAQEQLLVSTT